MVFLEVMQPQIDNWINANNGGQDARLEKFIRISMQCLAFVLLLVELAGSNIKESNHSQDILLKMVFFLLSLINLALIGESFLVFSYYSKVSHQQKFKPNCYVEHRNADIKNWNWSRINDINRNFEENPVYCDYGLYNFTISLLIMFWLIAGFAFGYFAWIYAGLPVQSNQNLKSNE